MKPPSSHRGGNVRDRKQGLTERLSRDDPGVLPGHGRPGVPLVQVLYEGVSLVHGAADYLPILGEDDLYIRLLDDGRVEVSDEDSGVEGARVVLVGHVAGLGFSGHPPRVALLGHTQRRGSGL